MVPPGVPHTFANPGDQPLVMINTFSPDLYVQYFRDVRGAMADGTPQAAADVAGQPEWGWGLGFSGGAVAGTSPIAARPKTTRPCTPRISEAKRTSPYSFIKFRNRWGRRQDSSRPPRNAEVRTGARQPGPGSGGTR
jgi:hypothetical protein